MKDFLEKTLHQKVSIEENVSLIEKLPLVFHVLTVLSNCKIVLLTI